MKRVQDYKDPHLQHPASHENAGVTNALAYKVLI